MSKLESTLRQARDLFFLVLLLLSPLGCASRSRPTVELQAPSSSGMATLTVTAVGLTSREGSVALALFDSADDFKKRSDAVAAERILPTPEGSVTWRIDGLPPGRYALAAYHDLNDNGELDRPALGPPSEPYGFSNGARGTFGPPSFDEAAVEIGPGALTLEVELRP